VHAVRVQAWGSTPSLELTLRDDTGSITVVFLGRRHVAGIEPGARMIVTGTVGEHGGLLAILNPLYELLA
jgi:hydrogenase maturation factor